MGSEVCIRGRGHAIELVDVLRQKDAGLVSALNEVRSGVVPGGGATSALFRALARPLSPNEDGVLPTRSYLSLTPI